MNQGDTNDTGAAMISQYPFKTVRIAIQVILEKLQG